jgi:hypothetical protein
MSEEIWNMAIANMTVQMYSFRDYSEGAGVLLIAERFH